MCVSCGCHEYNDDHGNPNHLLLDEVRQAGGPEKVPNDRIQRAADAAEISVEEARQNVINDFQAAS